jgi:hypothetical protein
MDSVEDFPSCIDPVHIIREGALLCIDIQDFHRLQLNVASLPGQ